MYLVEDKQLVDVVGLRSNDRVLVYTWDIYYYQGDSIVSLLKLPYFTR